MMNRTSSARLLLGAVVFLLLVSLVPLASSQPVSASPDRLEWSVVDTPSGEDNVVVTPSEINALAISSNETFYALDIPGKKIYKSTDSGITWEDDITEALIDDGAELPAWDIAVASDDPDLVAVVTNNRTEVYYSKDGGDKWRNGTSFDLAGTLISDIAISVEYVADSETCRDVAIGTRKPTDTNGTVWTTMWRDLGMPWADQNLTADTTTVRFSPNYETDEMLFAIASPFNGTYLYAGQRNTDHDDTDWDTTIELIEPGQVSPTKDEMIFSALALPSDQDYSKKNWIAYAGYYSNKTCDDVYRIEKAPPSGAYRLNASRGGGVGIASLDYQEGTLITGEVSGEENSANALIHYCDNPLEDPPDWKEPTKPPTGGASSENRANAQVLWPTKNVLYCVTSTNNVTSAAEWEDTDVSGGHPWNGTGYDESAFSKSKDAGDVWNQFSLIDTEMDRLWDYVFSLNNSILYLVSVSGGGHYDSIWRTEKTTTAPLTETWQRVLCLKGANDIILRLVQEESNLIYFAVPGTRNVQYSEDKGQTWEQFRHCPEVTDLAVVSDELLYILNDDMLNKCSWNAERWGGIWEWEKNIDTGLDSGSAVIACGEDYVLVSEKDGKSRIAYSSNVSSDVGEIFNLTESLPQLGDIQFTVDEGFSSNKFIYAASDGAGSDIYRWTIGGTSEWQELNRPSGVTVGFCGLVQKGGVLYGGFQQDEGVARLLIPHLRTIRTTDWDTLPSADINISFKAGSLKATSNENVELWAIDADVYCNGNVSDYDNAVGRLWAYTDGFSLQAPWANSPPPIATDSIACDVCTCQAIEFCFNWRMLESTEKYDLWIALDEDFTAIIHKEGNITPTDEYSPAWCPGSTSLRFICGETYFWKVRSCENTEGERIRSPWSPPLKFKVKECSSEGGETHLGPLLLVPATGSKNIGRSPIFSWEGFQSTTEYEFILAKDVALTEVLVKEKVSTSYYQYQEQLAWDTTYYWQVRATEPVSSELSASVFTVMAQTGPSAQTPPTPSWVWVIIGILAFLDVTVIAFCLIKKR